MTGRMQRLFGKPRLILTSILVLISLPSLVAQEKLFILQGGELFVMDPSTGEVNASRRASGEILTATPGGKYVFVINGETGFGEAVDFESPSRSKEIDLSDWAPFSGIHFSPMGNRLFLSGSANNTVIAFEHRAGELSAPQSIFLEGPYDGAALTFNSRGTRLYTASGSGVAAFLAEDGSEVFRVNDAEADAWRMAPGDRNLWGTGPGGWLVVDVNRGRISARLQEIPGGPEVSNPVFAEDARRGWALADNGAVLVEFDVRRSRIKDRLSPERRAQFLSGGESGLWLAGPEGLEVYAEEEFSLGPDLPGNGFLKGFTLVRLKPGEGFACF